MKPTGKSLRRKLIALTLAALAAGPGCASVPENANEAGGGQAGQQAKLAPKAVTASNNAPKDSQPGNVIDGKALTHWSAGGPAPQWIQLDLGEETSVSKVRLSVSQTPAGLTTHEVYGGPSAEQLTLIGTLDAATRDEQWIELDASATNVRYLRVTTVKSPSWVAWREIEVFK